jgi:protocatechuate 3,4-dioxygenase beta subunit
MDNDDKPVGRVLSRREVIKLLGLASAATLAACGPRATGEPAATPAQATQAAAGPTPTHVEAQTAEALAADPTAVQATRQQAATTVAENTALPAPACVVAPELTEGPFFVDGEPERVDLRTDSATGDARPGTPLELTFHVSQISGGACSALAGAMVDVWHCDADGRYSGVRDGGGDTAGQDWLRGYQLTDASGSARFVTIYPGWYPGRTVHIHFKIRAPGQGGVYDFTSQLFFDEAVTAEVYTQPPYSSRGQPNTPNARDGIFLPETLLTPTQAAAGYSATFSVGLDLTSG